MKPRYRVKASSRPCHVVVPFAPTADQDVTEAIATISEMVAAGEIVSIGIAATRRNGGITTAFVCGRHLFPLMGAVRVLDRRLSENTIST